LRDRGRERRHQNREDSDNAAKHTNATNETAAHEACVPEHLTDDYATPASRVRGRLTLRRQATPSDEPRQVDPVSTRAQERKKPGFSGLFALKTVWLRG
ncbi:hypothetical protein, partial [uncultured Caballeronia sp.]|uniref:hypothetical protein n=1 Tax=uncultured Caballeronia sp. TaxID=1827198 RepID=UPI0035CA6A9C